MKVTTARAIIGAASAGPVFGRTSKMPGFSYGLDAFACERGGELARDPRSPCHGCYARRNFYATWGPVIQNRKAHQAAIHHERWTEAMVFLLERFVRPTGDHFFRMHDSGDLAGAWHLAKIVEVARATPWLKMWLPTHEPLMVGEFRDADGVIPSNLTIRISADYNDRPPTVANFDHRKQRVRYLRALVADLPTSTTHAKIGRPVQVSDRRKDTIECRAHERDHRCGPCRACWSPLVRNVSYPLSGGDTRVSRAQRSTALRVLQ